jgi:hypothetical protein
MDQKADKQRAGDPPGDGRRASGLALDGQSRRIKAVPVQEVSFFAILRGEKLPWICCAAPDAHVVGCVVDTAKRLIHLIVHSEHFEVVPDDAVAIPLLGRPIN